MKKQRVKHFASKDWADFVRQVAKPDRALAMQEHLDRGCQECSKAMGTWRSVLNIARRESGYIPNENAVRSAKAYFASYRPQKGTSPVARIAQLIYDSLLQPLPQGVRASSASARRLLYRLENALVDIRLEPEGARGRISLVGQVFDSAQPERGIHDLRVALLRNEDTVTEATTNEFGEFQMEFEAAERLWLRVEIEPGAPAFMRLRTSEAGPRSLA